MVHFAKLKKYALIALLAIAAFTANGCLAGGGSLTNLPETELAELNLQIRLGRVDADADTPGEVLPGKISADTLERIELRDMVLRFTSNLRDTVWDTVLAGVGTGFGSGDQEDQAITVNVALQPLRWWNIEIKTHDISDSIIHYAVVGPISSKGGQSVSLNVPLINSRYSLYEARYVLPEVIYPAGVPESERVYQKIFFSRLVLRIDSAVVRDTNSFDSAITAAGTRYISSLGAVKNSDGKFFFRPATAADTITHVQTYKYVRTGPRNFNIKAYGYLEGDSIGASEPRLLFEGNRNLTITAGATPPISPIILDWRGPGSERDPNAPPLQAGDPDWSGLKVEVFIGKVGKVTQTIEIDGSIP